MNWLKVKLRAWLDVPDYRKPSGGYYAEVRKALLDVREAHAEAILALDSAKTFVNTVEENSKRAVRMDEHRLTLAMNDFSNARAGIADVSQKVDALALALGIYVVTGDEKAELVPTAENMAVAQARHTLDAKAILQEMSALCSQARSSARHAAETEKKVVDVLGRIQKRSIT